MEYTKNYHLPQWVKEDRILMEDFNRMCADIEAGLNKTAANASAAKTQADEGVTNAAAAQGTADTAVSKADTAQATADQAVADAAAAQAKADAAYSPSQPPYAIGSYTGTNSEQSISVGFRPSFLIICTTVASSDDFLAAGNDIARTGQLEFTADGFKLYPNLVNQSVVVHPAVNSPRTTYVYIAFR